MTTTATNATMTAAARITAALTTDTTATTGDTTVTTTTNTAALNATAAQPRLTAAQKKAAKKAAAQQDAAAELADYDELTFICTYASTAGYSTHGYKVLAIHRGTGELHNVTYYAAAASDSTYKNDQLRVSGCGFSKPDAVTSEINRAAGRTGDRALTYRSM